MDLSHHPVGARWHGGDPFDRLEYQAFIIGETIMQQLDQLRTQIASTKLVLGRLADAVSSLAANKVDPAEVQDLNDQLKLATDAASAVLDAATAAPAPAPAPAPETPPAA